MRALPLARLLIALMTAWIPAAAQPPPQPTAPLRLPGGIPPDASGTTDRASRLIAVPSIIGLGREEAERRLAAARLALQTEQRAPPAPDARVVQQSPQPGVPVAPGTRVVAAFAVPPPQLVAVPSIIGMDAAEARRRLAATQLELHQDQAGVPGARVIRQQPQPGTRVAARSAVMATFERRPPLLVPVPSIIGDNPTEAVRHLAEAQLVLQPEQPARLVSGARVVRQNPPPGQQVQRGTQVVAAFELPPPQLVAVPSIIGATQAEAESRLTATRLVLQPEQRTPLAPGSKVVRQSPQPGQQVLPGTQVIAAFEAPPPPFVTVPSIIGVSQAEAGRRLSESQLVLQLEQRTQPASDSRVVRQNPQPGQRVPPGTQVVAGFEVPPPQPVTVPSIIGIDVTEALRRVAAAQLVLQAEQQTSPDPNDRVVRQSPQPGQQVPPGTRVVAALAAPSPQLVTVPSIIGTDPAEAQRRLAATQLVLQPEQQTPPDRGAKVVRQTPQSGQQVRPGTPVIATFEVASMPSAAAWIAGALGLIALGALVGLWRWVRRIRMSRTDAAISSVVHVHPRKDPGRPSIQSNKDPAGPALGLRVTRPPPVITLIEHEND